MLDPKHNRRSIRIAGFGACMISGYPHKDGGFFKLACEEIASNCGVVVTQSVHSLGGFPAPRAAKYLKKNVLRDKPDFVVIQLASLDALCPVRPVVFGSTPVGSHSRTQSIQSKPATLKSRVRWILASLLGYILRLEPTTPLPEWISAMDMLIGQCLELNATPIVIGPFVYGSLYSMRSGVRYAEALRVLAARRTEAIFVDALPALRSWKKTDVLQSDGFHLSKLGHAIVASQLVAAVTPHIEERTSS